MKGTRVMKKLFVLVLVCILMANVSFAQVDSTETDTTLQLSCEDLICKKVDDMTDEVSWRTKSSLLVSQDGKNGFKIYITKYSKALALTVYVYGSGNCINKDAKVIIRFRDGTKITICHGGKFNCNNMCSLYFQGIFGNQRALKQLLSKEIKTMRVYTYKSYVQEDFSPDESKILMYSLRHLSTK